MGVANGPYTANYNRQYDTHTEHGANGAFAVNPPDVADRGPYEFSDVGRGPKYVNPLNKIPDKNLPGRSNVDGYLGDATGPREIQTGNAASGGYTTYPGLGFADGFQRGVHPDNRRMQERTRSDDWEANQAKINRVDIGGNQDFRRGEVRLYGAEHFTPPVPAAPVWKSPNAITDSPYRQDWSEGHGPNGDKGLTVRTNPNPYLYLNKFDQASEKKNSGSRYLNGMHYSMAEHQTLQPYVDQTDGSNAVRKFRNTYRITPAPWDTTNTDGPSNTPEYVTTTNLYDGLPSRSYRL
jgi:hypothetical protein